MQPFLGNGQLARLRVNQDANHRDTTDQLIHHATEELLEATFCAGSVQRLHTEVINRVGVTCETETLHPQRI
jgi:hypothetical protein